MPKPFKLLAVFVGLFIFIKIFFPYYQVQTSSMEPTFKKGSIIFVSRFYYLFFSPQKEDVVLFSPVKGVFNKGVWTHRIIATAGDKRNITNYSRGLYLSER